MKSGETLIKLAKHKVDSVQKLIAAAQKAQGDLIRKMADLDAAAQREEAAARNDPSLTSNWVAYAKVLKGQQANLEASLSGVEEQIRALQGDLQGAFEEQKKFEMLEERRKTRELESRAKREQAFMDESALIRAARRG
jgi:flagellar protein FliJ